MGITYLSYFDAQYAMVDIVREGQLRGMDWSSTPPVDVNGAPVNDFRLMVSSIIIAAGVYKVKFKGQATISGSTNVLYNSATNTTTADWTVAANATGNLWIDFTNTKRTAASATNTGLTEIQIFRPGYPTDNSVYFTTEFITAMQKVSVIRTMDFVFVNQNPQATWTERIKPTWLGDAGVKGQSWELMALLANATGRDLWVTVPVKADQAYLTKLAQLFKYGSDGSDPYTSVQANPVYPPIRSDLKIYVEYGNEIWNFGPGFSCYGWTVEFANAYRSDPQHPICFDGTPDANLALRRTIAYRSALISQAFRTVFGDADMMTRVRPIFASQVGNAVNYLRDGLLWAHSYYGSAANIWYGGGGAAYYDSDSPSTVDSDDARTAYFAALPGTAFAGRIAIDATWTKSFGLKTIAYEGGPTPGGSPLGGIEASDAIIYTYSNDPRMSEGMLRAHNQWVSNGGDLFVFYVYSGPGPWSFVNTAAKPTVADTTSVKMLALDTIKTGVTATPSLGTLVPGTVNLRNASTVVQEISDGGSQWGYPGQGGAYLVKASIAQSFGTTKGMLAIATRFAAAGTFKVSINTLDAPAGSQVDLYAGGTLLGTLNLTASNTGLPVKSAEFTVNLPAGIVGFRVHARTGNVWVRDLNVLAT